MPDQISRPETSREISAASVSAALTKRLDPARMRQRSIDSIEIEMDTDSMTPESLAAAIHRAIQGEVEP